MPVIASLCGFTFFFFLFPGIAMAAVPGFIQIQLKIGKGMLGGLYVQSRDLFIP